MIRKIRNFSIIAHIDHGKSTLADRFLEITNTVPKEKLAPQYLDRLELEREKGITIKLAPVTMKYKDFLLNLIDTPGHVDFSYEVSRSLACVEGAILLVDATKGIEAQTLSNFLLARQQGLTIIPTINKVDLPNAEIALVSDQIEKSFGFKKEEIYYASAKTGLGVENLLDRIVNDVPAPEQNDGNKEISRALIFDSMYDLYKGVIAFVRIFSGRFKKNDKVFLLGTGEVGEINSLGIFSPDLLEKEELSSGEIGWIATGLKETRAVRVGDTIASSLSTPPLPGYKESKPMIFAGIFPANRDDFAHLKEALEKLRLNDASLVYEPEISPALGFGVRAGFLGLLHMEVIQERLEREFGLNLILSSPTVRYKILKHDGQELAISNPSSLPDASVIKEIKEPYVKAKIVTLKDYIGGITKVLYEHRAQVDSMEYFSDRVQIECTIPFAEIISQFYDRLQTVSSGFASFDYEPADYKRVDAVKLEILIAKKPVDALSQIVIKDKAYQTAKALVEKIKEVIPRQQFEVSIQASIGGKIIAAERIPAFRKDVTAKLYGGDRTRKDKLLEKQKQGKKRMKQVGNVEIPQDAFLAVLKI